jgi:hypothetical protein
MTSLQVGDLVELRYGARWLGTVLEVVESRPRWLLVYWHSPRNVGINPLLESEQFLTLRKGDEGRVEHAGRADPGSR